MADSLCISHFVISVFHLKQDIHNTLMVQGCCFLRVNMPGFTYLCIFLGQLFSPTAILESVQDFLIKLDMKPCMHLVEISIFSLNLVIIRLTKIMNRADKNLAQF